MNFIRNFFSSIVGSILTIILGLLIILYSFSMVVFDSNFILGTLEKNNTYKVIAGDVIPKFLVFAMTQKSEQQSSDQNIAKDIYQKLDKTTFDQLSPDFKKIVENSYDFVVGKQDQFEVRLQLKDYLPSFQQNLNSAVTSLQKEGQLQEFNLDETNANLNQADQASILITQDKIEVTGIKDLETNQNTNQNDNSVLRNARSALERVRQTQSLLIIAAIFLAVVLFATRLPHFLSGIKWLASTGISAAFLPLIFGFLGLVFKPVGMISGFLKEQQSVADFSTAIDLISKNLETIINKIFVNILTISSILMVSSIALFVIVFFLQQRQAKHPT